MANNPYVNKVQYGNNVLIDLTADTVAADKMLSGITAHDKSGAAISGSIASQGAQTITPTTSDIIIAAGKYLSGAQTIKGDANLLAENIKKDVSIFGVLGTLESGGGGITFPSDWYVEQWTQASDTQSLTFTHGLGQTPHFMACICCDSDAGSNGRILDVAISNAGGTAWLQNFVVSWNSSQTTKYSSQAVGYNGYDVNATTIVLTQGRYYSATFKANKQYLLLAYK